MSEHTKGELECGEDAALWIGDNKICTMNWLMTLKRGDPIIIHEDETQANAQRLVKCWNSHDDLLAACERGYQRLLEMGQKESHRTVKILKAAITKAKDKK